MFAERPSHHERLAKLEPNIEGKEDSRGSTVASRAKVRCLTCCPCECSSLVHSTRVDPNVKSYHKKGNWNKLPMQHGRLEESRMKLTIHRVLSRKHLSGPF